MASLSEASPDSEIFSRVVSANDTLPLPVARSVLGWKFPPADVARVKKLQAKNSAGTITAAERRPLESYVRVGQFVAVMQAKTQLTMKQRGKA